MGDWANAMGIETVYIDKDTNIRQLRNELRWNEAYYKFHWSGRKMIYGS